MTTGWTGSELWGGVAVALHGLDQVQAGLRQLFTDCNTRSFTSKGLQAAGLSPSTANLVDAGISVVGSAGAGLGAQAVRAGGIGNMVYYEIGQNTLSPSNYAKYGQIADREVERDYRAEYGLPRLVY